jgi:hypothetical protein
MRDPARPARGRPFDLKDALIAIGLVAAWMAYLRNTLIVLRLMARSTNRQKGTSLAWWQVPRTGFDWLMIVVPGLTIGLILFTLGFFVFRMRPPRAPIERLIRQPGTLACLVVFGLFLIVLGLQVVTPGINLELLPPVAIVGTWLVAGATGWLERERGWIDPLGCALGLAWCAVSAFWIVWGPG